MKELEELEIEFNTLDNETIIEEYGGYGTFMSCLISSVLLIIEDLPSCHSSRFSDEDNKILDKANELLETFREYKAEYLADCGVEEDEEE